ncbi:MAG: thioredoxin family protein [Candidatus Bathyarchaeota archaeon]|nr:thioredoxin family protein [Candidatus Bathyarchaeota archaeon]
MKIEVLGSGCQKCRKLEAMVKFTVGKLGLDAEVTHIHDMDKILGYGVMMTPALVVDGEVRLSGKLPSENELEKLLQ